MVATTPEDRGTKEEVELPNLRAQRDSRVNRPSRKGFV